jgi:hypothetical protein
MTKLSKHKMIIGSNRLDKILYIDDKMHYKPREPMIFYSRYSKLIHATTEVISRKKKNIFAFHPTETPKGFLNYIYCEASIIFVRFRTV